MQITEHERRPVFFGQTMQLFVEHVEKHWAPTITSAQVLEPSSARAEQPRIVFAIAEDEYFAKDTLPAFAHDELEAKLHWHPTLLQSDDKTDLPGTEALDKADLLVLFMRRRELPPDQLGRFKK